MEQRNDISNMDMLTVKDVCAKLRISRWMVYRLIRSGALASVKIGTRRLIPQHSLEAYEKQLEEEGGSGYGRKAW
jgi:excisionase family DNA binding protein